MKTTEEAKAKVTKLKNAISAKETRLSKKKKGLGVKEHLEKLLEMLNNKDLKLKKPT